MEGSDGSSTKESLSGWSIVNSQGELVQGDGDSDSSESSIEVVSVEGSDVVSFHHSRKESTELAENENGRADLRNREMLHESNSSEEMKHAESTSNTITSSEILGEDSALVSSDTTIENAVLASRVSTELPAVQVDFEEKTEPRFSAVDSSVSLPPTQLEPCAPDLDQLESTLRQSGTRTNPSCGSDTEPYLEQLGGACCEELLSQSERGNIQANTDASFQPNVASGVDELEEGNASIPSQISSKANSTKGESDSDSDFVRLDSDNLNDFEPQVEAVPLHRSRSSIDENFHFFRGQEVRAPMPQPPEVINNHGDENDGFDGDIDRDDETESSTEEGVDDRIESEQSEAESHSNLNDVGDLSAFADIGDIPLVVGDVRRNYIHRPNNYLSSVLNVILVLATILTMGISLGIIMATDLEIEEWQNAYELQTMRVKQLQLQVQEKDKMLETKNAKVAHLDILSKQLRLKLADSRDQLSKHKKVEKALDWLEARSVVEGGQFGHAAYLVRAFVQVFVHCEEELGNRDTDSDNGSFVPTSLCTDQLETYILKLRTLASGKKPPFSRADAFSVDSEAWHSSTLTTGFSDQDEASRDYGDDGMSKQHHKVKSTPKPEGEIARDHKDSDEQFLPQEGLHVDTEEGDSKVSHNLRQAHKDGELQAQDVVDLDIRQLQQSLSREQERALHWQHLYLFERRQRERERENEEWEDERDREQWEKEWEQERENLERSKPDLEECLKKILASNLTTLTQHMANWNITVFDDFANLSVLLHSVQDLKESVVDSASKVWKGAEEVLEKMRASFDNQDGTESQWGKNFASKQETLTRYLLEVMQSIQENSGAQLEMLLANLQNNLNEIKKSFKSVGNEINSDTLAHVLEQAWQVTGNIIGKLQRDVGNIVPEKQVLMAHLKNVLENWELHFANFKQTVRPQPGKKQTSEAWSDESWQSEDDEDTIGAVNDDFSSDINNDDKFYDDDDDEDDDGDDEDNDGDDEDEENETSKPKGEKSSWSSGFINVLSKTKKSFKQLGQKVSRTFGEIKTIWDKKNMPLIRIAKRLASKFMRASVKLTKMCSRLPTTFFKQSSNAKDEDQVLIYSKCVKKLRKQWQKELLRNPCEAAGRLSFECNTDRKTLKSETKEVSKLFSQLLKIKTFQPTDVVKLSKEDVALHLELFRSFLERWGGRSLLLKKDLEWVVCQRDWWSQVLQAVRLPSSKVNIQLNNCDVLSSTASFFPGGSAEELDKLRSVKDERHKRDENDEKQNKRDENDKKQNKRDENNNYTNDENKAENKLSRVKSFQHEMPSHGPERINVEATVIEKNESSFGGYTVGGSYVPHDRKGRKHSQKFHDNTGQKYTSGKRKYVGNENEKKTDWYIKKAQHRKRQREEHSKSDWMFERARHRRYNSWKEQNDEQDRDFLGKRKYSDDENWILKHGQARQQQREEEHRADWVFSRASDRKVHRQSAFPNCHHSGHNRNSGSYDENFRCAYGKVSSP